MAKRKVSPAYQALAPAGAFRFLPEPGRDRFGSPSARLKSPAQQPSMSKIDQAQAEFARKPPEPFRPPASLADIENEAAQKRVRDMLNDKVESEAKAARIARIREIGARQKAEMQRMLNESQARQAGGEAGARLKAKMDQLEEAKAAMRGPTQVPRQRVTASTDPFGAAAGEEATPTAPMRISSGTLGRVGIGIGTGIAGGALMDYLVRRAESRGETPIQRIKRKYAGRYTT